MPIQSTNLYATNTDAFDFTSADAIYTVQGGVTVQSEQADGVNSHGNDHIAVNNHGDIVGSSGIVLDADFSNVSNAEGASIFGRHEGIFCTGAHETIDNQGTITGDEFGISNSVAGSVYNSGSIIGRDVGIIAGAGEFIDNSGVIVANGSSSSPGVQIGLGAGDSGTVENSGRVAGVGESIVSIGAGALKITNRGTLDGSLNLLNTGGDTVYNQSGGEIDGNVKLGNGANTFDGRGGSIEHGYIAGGSKVDTVYLGNDGESVNAGAGHDMLHGGNGNDTFAFTSFASTNSDTIFGFNVTRDVVQLNHAEFTKLTAGTTPAFSIGSAAASAHDYLFYNSASGNLFYDPDGSGAGHANLIAKLDPFLKMTAHDFKVI